MILPYKGATASCLQIVHAFNFARAFQCVKDLSSGVVFLYLRSDNLLDDRRKPTDTEDFINAVCGLQRSFFPTRL